MSSTRGRQLLQKQRIDERLRVEHRQVGHLLAGTHIADRPLDVLSDRESDPSLGGAVQLGDGHIGHIHRLHKRLGL